jgi:glycosyltransferase involved in cell wall biosynthesis
LKHGISILRLYRRQLKATRHPEKYSGNHGKQLNFLSHRVADAEKIAHAIRSYNAKSIVVYSYWFNVWAMSLLLTKELKLANISVLTRAHGGDLDENQKKQKYFPFRSLEIQLIDKVVSVSEFGQRLLSEAYPDYSNRFAVSRLGVNDCGVNPPAQAGGCFRVVTCSFVYGLKRLHLVADILERTGLEIDWIHFGDGELMESLKKRCSTLPDRITTEFRGLVANSEVINYYATEHVDLFMNVSELEGIPVSIMEAISFGIPVTGCRICGVPEIVTSQTGLLLEKDFDIGKVAGQVQEFLLKNTDEREKFRKGVREFWNENFNAKENYLNFIESYLKQ